MPTTQYIGSRYVPLLADPVEWSAEKEYESLTIVTHEGNSYTSRQFAPKGIDITNEAYWALTGNYNGQVEQYRRETQQAVAQINDWYDEAVTEYADKYGAKPFAFDTVTAMQNARDLLYVGAICHTNGFKTSGDGGGAWYLIGVANNANGMDVIACGNELQASLIPQNDTLNVLCVGMSNDGVTTGNTSIYNEMIAKGYRKFYFPSGTYLINIDIDKKMTEITGAGIGNESVTGRTVFKHEVTTNYIIKMNNANYSLENCRVSDILIDGNNFVESGILFEGQAVSYSNDFHIFNNIYITNCNYGIHANGRMNWNTFNNVTCYGMNTYGLYFEQGNVGNLNSFTQCIFRRCKKCGVYWDSSAVQTGATRSNRFESCDFEANGKNDVSPTDVTAYGLYYNGITALSIVSCYFEENGPTGNQNSAAIYFGVNTIEGLVISGNIIWGSAYAIYMERGNRSGGAIFGNKIAGKIEALANGIGGFTGTVIDNYFGNNVPSYNNFINGNVILNPLHISCADTAAASPSTLRYTTQPNTDAPDMSDSLSVGRIIIFMPLGAGSYVFNRANGYYLKDDAQSLTITANKCIAFIGIYNGYHELFRSV